TRHRLGLAPLDYVHGGLSRQLCMVATFPQLEYPRAWAPWEHVVGPLFWEQPYGDVELPPGDAALVLVAPATSQDPDQRLGRGAGRGPGCSFGSAAARTRTRACRVVRSARRRGACGRSRGELRSAHAAQQRAGARRADVARCVAHDGVAADRHLARTAQEPE